MKGVRCLYPVLYFRENEDGSKEYFSIEGEEGNAERIKRLLRCRNESQA